MTPALECVAYEKNKHDTHKAADPGARTFTAVQSAKYIYLDRGKWVEKWLEAGSIIPLPDIILSEACGRFYASVKNKLKEQK